MVLERWPSGLRHDFAKVAWEQSHRGFKSRSLRQFFLYPMKEKTLCFILIGSVALGLVGIALLIGSAPAFQKGRYIFKNEADAGSPFKENSGSVAVWRMDTATGQVDLAMFTQQSGRWTLIPVAPASR